MRVLKPLAISVFTIIGIAMVLLYESDIPKDVIDTQYRNPSSQFMELENKTRLHYRDEGNRFGEPILLVHGFGSSLHTWTKWVELLGNDFRIISFDLPGHGLTGEVPDRDYSLSADIKTIENLADKLSLETFTIAGHSMGGSIAWHFAMTNPNRSKALILINAAGLTEWHEPYQLPFAFNILRQGWFVPFAQVVDPYYLISAAITEAYNNSPVIDKELILRFYYMNMRKGTRQAMASRSRSMRTNGLKKLELKKIDLPTLIIWGRQDAIIDVAIADNFKPFLNDSTLKIYDKVGHVPMEESPRISGNDVKKFMLDLRDQTQE